MTHPLKQLLLFLLTLAVLPASAQQLPLFELSRDNAFLVNPAITVLSNLVDNTEREDRKYKVIAGLTYRNQWTKLKANGPNTYTARLNFKVPVGDATLWTGGYFISDQVGPLRMTGAYTTGSVHLYLGGGRYLQGGVSLGALQFGLDPSKIELAQEDDQLVTTLLQNQWFFDPGVGVFYSSPKFYVGASIPKILTNRFDRVSTETISINTPHIYGMAGAYIVTGTTNRKSRRSDMVTYDSFIEPSVFVKYVNGLPFLADVNLKYQTKLRRGYSDFWGAVGFNTNKAWRAQIGWVLPMADRSPLLFKWNITYGQQIGVSQLFGSSLEIGLMALIKP